MGNVKNGNYFVIQGWMINELKLKGNELIVYAIIYGFSQDGNYYTGSLQYIAEWANISKRSVINTIQKLINLGFVEKMEVKNKSGFNSYRAVENCEIGVKNLHPSSEKFSPQEVKKFHQPGEKSSPPNINIIIKDNIDNNSAFDQEDAFKRFWALYPKHVNKKKAHKKFLEICKNQEMLSKILSAIVDQKESQQWRDPKFIPHPSTWLNNERWNDELDIRRKSFMDIDV